MVTKTLHKAIPASLLAASLAVFGTACGSAGGRGGGGDGGSVPARPSATSAGGSIADRVVYFSTSVRAAAGAPTVIHDRSELTRFAAAFTAGDPQAAARIAAVGRATEFGRRVLVGWTGTTGCSAATAAALTASGERLSVRVSQPKPPPECLAAFAVTVVFEVPKERIPARAMAD